MRQPGHQARLRHMLDPTQLLLRNGALQVAFSILLGWLMLVPRQPWGTRWAFLKHRDFTAAHVDWLMLAFMQFGAGLILREHPSPRGTLIALSLIGGGWLNPVPYVLRALHLDAFTPGATLRQRATATLSAISSVALTTGWAILLLGFTAPS